MSRPGTGWVSGALALALLAAVVATGSAPPRRAHADARAAEGRFFHERGQEAFQRRRYDAAVEHFLVAYRATPNPRALFNVALAALAADRLALAFTSFVEFLESDDDDAERRALATRRRAELARRLALVEVTTDPPGAALFVGRRERGIAAVSPAQIPLTESGTVEIFADLEGHLSERAEVQARPGETVRLHLNLIGRTGELVLALDPPDARATVLDAAGDDIVVGEGIDVPVGRYTVRVEAEGHAPRTASVTVRESATARVELALQPLPRPTGRLLVDSDVHGVTVRVDGRVVGTTPLGLTVSVGEHVVAVGPNQIRRRVTVSASRPTYVAPRVGLP